jgi:hypothetical protein
VHLAERGGGDLSRALVAGAEEVGDEDEPLRYEALQADAVLERAEVVADVQRAGR